MVIWFLLNVSLFCRPGDKMAKLGLSALTSRHSIVDTVLLLYRWFLTTKVSTVILTLK